MKEIKVLALGSSITRGYGNNGVSFCEMLNDYQDNEVTFKVKKEAIDGTSLANRNNRSYLARLRNYKEKDLANFNYVLIQLSTNDLHLFRNKDDLNDERSTVGAINAIFKYLKENFKGKVTFYTCFMKENKKYSELINKLLSFEYRYHFDILDFYTNQEMLLKNFKSIMKDGIHPNEEGYKIMTKYFVDYFKSCSSLR